MQVRIASIILVILFTVLCVQAETVEETGRAFGGRADSVQVRSEALHHAVVNASAIAGVFIESDATLLDNRTMLASVQISSAGKIESIEILSEGWITDDMYEVRIRAAIEPRNPDEEIRNQPSLNLQIAGDEQCLRQLATPLASALEAYGFRLAANGTTVAVICAEPVLTDNNAAVYCDLEGIVRVGNGESATRSTFSERSSGLSREMAFQRCLMKVANALAEDLSARFAEDLAGLERQYTLRINNPGNPLNLVRMMEAVPWLKSPQVITRNAAIVELQVTTSRTTLIINEWMQNRGYRFLQQQGMALEFARQNTADDGNGDMSIEQKQPLPLSWFIGGLVLALVIVILVRKRSS